MASFAIRLATEHDIPELRALIEASVLGLQTAEYTASQMNQALNSVYGVDSALIADGTYFAVESDVAIIGCGGWSRRKTLFGGDHFHGRQDSLLDPAHDAAKIRAFFVHPDHARKGIGSMILDACEAAARSAGFTRLEMGATLTGVPFYAARGYTPCEELTVPLADGDSLQIVRMAKSFAAV